MTPTIALCIPAYNAAWCLPRLLASAHAQESPFDEILVYNDCSRDDTALVAKKFGATVVSGEVNVGCSAGKNALIEYVKSEWIHFHDADDLLLSNFTRLAHTWITRREQCPDVVLFDYEYRDNETNELIVKSNFSPEQLEADPVRYAILNQINPFCGLYRRSKLEEVGCYDTDPEILFNEDVAFHCKLALAGFSFGVEKEVSIVNYRIGGSMSQANQHKCMLAHCAVMRRIGAVAGTRYPEEIAKRFWGAATSLATFKDWVNVDRALDEASQLYRGVPEGFSSSFSWLCRLCGCKRAFRIRENSIRILKPHLRGAW